MYFEWDKACSVHASKQQLFQTQETNASDSVWIQSEHSEQRVCVMAVSIKLHLMRSLICNRHNLHVTHKSLATTRDGNPLNDFVDHHCKRLEMNDGKGDIRSLSDEPLFCYRRQKGQSPLLDNVSYCKSLQTLQDYDLGLIHSNSNDWNDWSKSFSSTFSKNIQQSHDLNGFKEVFWCLLAWWEAAPTYLYCADTNMSSAL